MLQGMAAFSSRRYLDGSVKPPVRAALLALIACTYSRILLRNLESDLTHYLCEKGDAMKKQKKLILKARDLTPLKHVTGGRHHKAHGSHAHGLGLVERGDFVPGSGLFGHRSPQ
jgi:hypothetical protein